jgi:hypothetical protein
MRTIPFLLAGILFLGMNTHPLTVLADTTTATQSPVVKRMYLDWVKLRDQVRSTKMEISDLQGKIGATINIDNDRESLNLRLETDIDKLRDYQAALLEETTVLAAHWSELTPDQQFDVREEQTYPE